MAKTTFENLRIFQQAERLADQVWDVVKAWDTFAKRTVGTQLVRAADSVGANIAEGVGRGRGKDQQRFVRIARGSLYETRFWLRRAYRRGLLAEDEAQHVRSLIEHLTPQLNAYLRATGNNAKNRQPKRTK